MREPVAEVRLLHHLVKPGGVGLMTGDREGQLHVLARVQHGEQVEELEHEADVVAAQLGKRVVAELRYVRAVDLDRAGGGPVEPGEDVHQGGLAGAVRTHHGSELSALD